MKYIVLLLLLLMSAGIVNAQHSDSFSGVANCQVCHAGLFGKDYYTPWSKTKHAVAYDSVAVIQNNVNCLGCHTTGWDTLSANGGFDDYYTAGDQAGMEKMKNVQCESCHTPHATKPDVDLSASNCGKCHEGTHHPYFAEWQSSLHAVAKATRVPGMSFIASNSNCAACHTAEGFMEFVNETDIVPDVTAPGEAGHDITCSACHNPHEDQLRLPAAELCSKCHNPEYDPNSPNPDGSDVHHATAHMFEGKGGYQYADFTYESSLHTLVITEKCVTCHVVATEFVEPQGASTGHTFYPKGEACVDCHTDFNASAESFDYRGVQTEIDSLLTLLSDKLAIATPADSATDDFKRAKFNRDFVESDGSHGIHNTKYARGLLTSSLAKFNPTAIEDNNISTPMGYMLKQNYPNPFNPVTTIEFSIPERAEVNLQIFNSNGQLLYTLLNGTVSAGWQKISFNGHELASGVYYCKLTAEDFVQVRKMILMK